MRALGAVPAAVGVPYAATKELRGRAAHRRVRGVREAHERRRRAHDRGEEGLRLAKDAVLRRGDGHARHERFAHDGHVGAGCVHLEGATLGTHGVVGVAEAARHGRVGTLTHVGWLALGEGRERQALQRVDRAPILNVHQHACALHGVGVLVQVGVQARKGLVGDAARLTRHGAVVRVVHGHVVVLGRLQAPLVDLRLRHEDLAVVPALAKVCDL